MKKSRPKKLKLSAADKTVLVINNFVLALLALSFIFGIVTLFLEPENRGTNLLTTFQSLLGIMLMLLPFILKHKFKLQIPNYLKIILVVFVYAAIFLGEVRSFYYKYAFWDTICHACSGAIFGILSFSFLYLMNSNKKVHLELSAGFIALFSFCFAVTTGALWEIIEFAIDSVLKVNMQKFIPELPSLFNGGDSGAPLQGTDAEIAEFFRSPAGYRYALLDTMEDIIVDCVGALVMAVSGYLLLKFKKISYEKLVIHALPLPTDNNAALDNEDHSGEIGDLDAKETDHKAAVSTYNEAEALSEQDKRR